MVYVVATVEPPLLQVFYNTAGLPEEKRSPDQAEEGKKKFSEVLRVLEKELSGKPYLLGDHFTAADIIGSSFRWARSMGLIAESSSLNSYIDRLIARPAFKRATQD